MLKLLLACTLPLTFGFISLLSCQEPVKTGPEPDWTGWTLLSDGSSTDDWEMAGPGDFVVENGAFKATGGMGLFWYAKRPFKDFALSLEWQVEAAENNSGIFVRFPHPGNDPWVAVNQGYELQICDSGGAKHDTGSVYSFQAASHIPTKAVGEWNRYEITVIGQTYSIKINGERVNVYEGNRTLEGYIGMQNHDDASPVRYRNIYVKEIQ